MILKVWRLWSNCELLCDIDIHPSLLERLVTLNTFHTLGKIFARPSRYVFVIYFCFLSPPQIFSVFFVFSRPILPTFQVLPILPISRSVKWGSVYIDNVTFVQNILFLYRWLLKFEAFNSRVSYHCVTIHWYSPIQPSLRAQFDFQPQLPGQICCGNYKSSLLL